MKQQYRNGRRLLWLLIVVTLSLPIGSAMGLTLNSTPGQEQAVTEARKIVAKVNGKPIYYKQLEPAIMSELRKFRKYGIRKQDPKLLNQMEQRVLDRMIRQELLDDEVQKANVEGIDEKVQQRLEELETKHGSRQPFETYLKRNHLTRESLMESLRKRIRIDEYLRAQGILEPSIPEERIREEYETHPENYTRKESVKVSHILIKVDQNAGDEEKQQAKQEAERIRGLLLEGEDFAEMAKKYSDCNSASGGGNLKYIKKGYMPEQFEQVAFAIEENTVSEVVQTRFGYHLIQVFDKVPGGVAPYEEIRDFIKKYLQEKESEKKLAAHMAELKEKAKVEVFLPE